MRNPFLRTDESAASFLPQEYVTRKNEMRANLICLTLFGVVMFGVVSAFFVTNRQWLTVQSEQTAITAQYTQESTRIEQYKRLEAQKSEMIEKAEIATALVEKVPRSKLLSEVVTSLPRDITLLEVALVSKRIKDAPLPASRPGANNQIKTLSGKPASPVSAAKGGAPKPTEPPKERVQAPRFEFTLRLIGVARANTDVADYLQALKASPVLDNVDLKFIKETTIDKVDLRRFEIEAQIRKDADARGIKAVDLRSVTAGGVPGADPTRKGATGGKASVRPAITQVETEKED